MGRGRIGWKKDLPLSPEIVLTYANGSVAKRNLAMQRRYSCVACMKCFRSTDRALRIQYDQTIRAQRMRVGRRCFRKKCRAVGEVAQVPDSLDPSSSRQNTRRNGRPSKNDTLSTMAAKQDTGGDASSLSDPNAATFTHLSVAWDVNFDTHVITATAQYDVTVNTKGSDLFLDTKGLSVSSVSVDGTEIADWTLEDDIEVRYMCLIDYFERAASQIIFQ